MVGASGTAGNLANHVCIAMARDNALRKQLADSGVSVPVCRSAAALLQMEFMPVQGYPTTSCLA